MTNETLNISPLLSARKTQSPPKLANYSWSDVAQRGGSQALFRLSQPFIHIANSVFISWTTLPSALAADGIALTMKGFFIHTPGSFIHLISFHFKINNFHENSNLYYAANIIVTGLNTLELPLLIFSGDILHAIFNLDPILCQNIQEFFRGFSPGLILTGLFSVNRQFLNSECSKAQNLKIYSHLLTVVGFGGLLIFTVTGYWLIPTYGNRGSGYTYSITVTFEYLASLAMLMHKKEFRQNLIQRPNFKLILSNIRRTLDIHIPVSLRFLAESFNGVAFSLVAAAINQNSLTGLHICNTALQLIDLPCFSFYMPVKTFIISSLNVAKTSFMATFLPTAYASAWEIPFSIPTISNWICDLFLSAQSPENREAIKSLVTTLFPIMGVAGILGCLQHGQRGLLQAGGQRIDNQENYEKQLIVNQAPNEFPTLKKENWAITGNTIVFQSLPFLSLCWVIGKYCGFDVQGIAILNLLCMVALILGLTPRTINFLRNPSKPPHDCWATIFPSRPDYLPTHATPIQDDANEETNSPRLSFI